MDRGVHAELAVTGESVCPVATASETAQVRSVVRAAVPDDAVEFTAETALEANSVEGDGVADIEEVFRHDDAIVYRFRRPAGTPTTCACEVVERHGSPVRHLRAEDGVVVLSFVAHDLDTLRRVVEDLREQYDGVSLRRLTQSDAPEADTDADLVLVDRAALTDRQREVLRTAHEDGYFDYPKSANATEVATDLGINRTTFAEHLAAAQSKLLDAVLNG
jgi:predicted DNA binding protein